MAWKCYAFGMVRRGFSFRYFIHRFFQKLIIINTGFSLILPYASYARGAAGYQFYQTHPSYRPQDHLQSKITFDKKKQPIIDIARIEDTDPLLKCPLETLPPDLESAMDNLVTKVDAAVAELATSRGSRCDGLTNRLSDVRAQVGDAIRYRFLFGDNNEDQAQVNANVQRASAMSAMILTATSLVESDCITNLQDQVIVQKLIGQIITLGGLFIGGWEGIGLAAVGMLIGNVPIFRSDIDKAREIIREYREINKRSEFLCMLRRMQRLSCLLFAHDKNQIVNGFDLTLKTGPARLTEESLKKYRSNKKHKRILHDFQFLRTMVLAAEGATTGKVSVQIVSGDMPDRFDGLFRWCKESRVIEDNLLQIESHPSEVVSSIVQLKNTCTEMVALNWSPLTKSADNIAELLFHRGWDLRKLVTYYSEVKRDFSKVEGQIAATWESHHYFLDVANSVKRYRDMDSGNQARLNFLNLTVEIANTLGEDSFDEIFDEDHQDLTSRNCCYPNKRRALGIRKRALTAMLDLCKTFDPTLACLYADEVQDLKFFKTWKKKCVGPSSKLCKQVLNASERNVLISDHEDRAYFDSLCGIIPWEKPFEKKDSESDEESEDPPAEVDPDHEVGMNSFKLSKLKSHSQSFDQKNQTLIKKKGKSVSAQIEKLDGKTCQKRKQKRIKTKKKPSARASSQALSKSTSGASSLRLDSYGTVLPLSVLDPLSSNERILEE